MSEKFQPPRGTRDFLPEEMIVRQEVIDKIRLMFETFGFQPLETPAIEDWEVLSAKGGGGPEILKETYKFKDKGDRWVGLRYDLTVPLSRVIAMNRMLALPFKRYQIERVWRYGDVTKGRLREFLQADIDTVGSESMLADAEIVASTIFTLVALGFKNFVVRLNNRKILTGLVKYARVEKTRVVDTFRTIDKLDKIGPSGVRKELLERGVSEESTKKIMEFIKIEGDSETTLKRAEYLIKGIKEGEDGIKELEELISYLRKMSVEPKFKVDLSLARGLDYYTGPIFEVFAEEGIGSLAGGGRYDKMIGLFRGEDIPATGISLGIERIIQVMKDRGMIKEKKTKVKILVINVNKNVINDCLEIVQKLRENGVASDFNLRGRNLIKQLEYADSLNVPYVLIVGPEEVKVGEYKLKKMETGEEKQMSLAQIISAIQN